MVNKPTQKCTRSVRSIENIVAVTESARDQLSAVHKNWTFYALLSRTSWPYILSTVLKLDERKIWLRMKNHLFRWIFGNQVLSKKKKRCEVIPCRNEAIELFSWQWWRINNMRTIHIPIKTLKPIYLGAALLRQDPKPRKIGLIALAIAQ